MLTLQLKKFEGTTISFPFPLPLNSYKRFAILKVEFIHPKITEMKQFIGREKKGEGKQFKKIESSLI